MSLWVVLVGGMAGGVVTQIGEWIRLALRNRAVERQADASRADTAARDRAERERELRRERVDEHRRRLAERREACAGLLAGLVRCVPNSHRDTAPDVVAARGLAGTLVPDDIDHHIQDFFDQETGEPRKVRYDRLRKQILAWLAKLESDLDSQLAGEQLTP